MFGDIATIATSFWVIIGVVVVANGYFVYQVRMARYRVMQSLADKGQPVPIELFNGEQRRAPVGLMRAGLILIAIGIALGTFFWSMTEQSVFHGPDRERELASHHRALPPHDRRRAAPDGHARTPPAALGGGKHGTRAMQESALMREAAAGDVAAFTRSPARTSPRCAACCCA